MTIAYQTEVLERVLNGVLSYKEAAVILGCSTRTIGRRVIRFKARGADGLVHGLKGRRSNRAKPTIIKDEVVGLYRECYRGRAISMFVRDVVDSKGLDLSRETIRKWLIEAGLWEVTPRSVDENVRGRIGEEVHACASGNLCANCLCKVS